MVNEALMDYLWSSMEMCRTCGVWSASEDDDLASIEQTFLTKSIVVKLVIDR